MTWTLTPIQLTSTEYLRQPSMQSPILPYTDATSLPGTPPFDGEDILGIHDVCEGAMNLTQISATTTAIACWTCGFRITVPSIIMTTYGDLRALTPVGSFRSQIGAPNGVVMGIPGDLYTNKSGGAGTTLWVKESGFNTNTGWIAK